MLNKVIVVGNLGDDPKVYNGKDNKKFARLALACNEKWKDKQGNSHEHTEWVNVLVNDPQASNVAKFLSKGSRALVEGKLKTRKYTDKQGVEKYATDVIASRVLFLDPPKKQNEEVHVGANIPEDDDIPF